MKIRLLLFLLFASLGASAQVYQNPNPGLYGIRYSRIAVDSTFSIPTGNGAPTLKSNRTKQGAIYQDSTAHITYIYDGKLATWSPVGTGSGFATKTTITKAGSDVNAAGYIDLSASTVPTFPTIQIYIDGVQIPGIPFWNPTTSRIYGFSGSESAGSVIKIVFI